jgi:glyoxylase-like metal-dependent hydrolase (beta-lactamase superfamily II)/rhodanese-related sulfurtransferase
MVREMSVAELASRLGAEDEPFIVDVREPDEFAAWSIPGAVNIPLAELPARMPGLPTDRELVAVCRSGNRSTQAASTLSDSDRQVANLVGGMLAWAVTYDSVLIELGDVQVVQVRRRGKGCLSYVVGGGDLAFVVDPSLDIDVYFQITQEHAWRITKVFDTHLHADHLSGARSLAVATGASLHLNPADRFDFEYEPLADSDRFELSAGAAANVAVLGTPGHTNGSTMYLVADRALLSGDTLFVESVGRPDLADRAEEYARKLYASLHDKVLGLPDDTLVLPAHYGDAVTVRPGTPVAATLGELRRNLDVLSLDEATFVAWATERAAPRPPNYEEIIKANVGTAALPLTELRQLELGPNRCAVSA